MLAWQAMSRIMALPGRAPPPARCAVRGRKPTLPEAAFDAASRTCFKVWPKKPRLSGGLLAFVLLAALLPQFTLLVAITKQLSKMAAGKKNAGLKREIKIRKLN